MPVNRFLRDGKLDVEPLVAELDRFLALVLKQARLELKYEIRRRDAAVPAEEAQPEVAVVFRGRDEDLLLAHNADLMMAIEYIAHRWLHLDPHFFDQVHLDCADYRANRLVELQLSAKVAAQRVRETKEPFRLNPM